MTDISNCPKQKCSDGTEYGVCSQTKPKFCEAGSLFVKASTCGCDVNYDVQDNECVLHVDNAASSAQESSISQDLVLSPSQTLIFQQDLSMQWQAKDSWGQPVYSLSSETKTSQCDDVYILICDSMQNLLPDSVTYDKNNAVISCSGSYCYDPNKESPNNVTLSGTFAYLNLDYPDAVKQQVQSQHIGLTKQVNLAAASFTLNSSSLTTTQIYSVGGQRSSKRMSITAIYYASISEAQNAFQKKLADAMNGKNKLDFDKPVGNERFGSQKVTMGYCSGTGYVFRRNNVLVSGEIGITGAGCPEDSDKNEMIGYLTIVDPRLTGK